MTRPLSGWDQLDKQSVAFVMQRQIEREVRRHLKARRFKREILPIFVCLGGALACLGYLAWTIWG